jgi:hypothetical protein
MFARKKPKKWIAPDGFDELTEAETGMLGETETWGVGPKR